MCFCDGALEIAVQNVANENSDQTGRMQDASNETHNICHHGEVRKVPASVAQWDARWLSLTGDQDTGLISVGSGNILSWGLIMKYFLLVILFLPLIQERAGACFCRKNVHKNWLMA